MNSLPIPRTTITEIVAHYDAALVAYQRYFDALRDAHSILVEAHQHVADACCGEFALPYVEHHKGEIDAFRQAIQAPDCRKLMSVARRLTGVQVWGSIIERTALESLMDRTAKDELRRQMAYVPEEIDAATGTVLNQRDLDRALPPSPVTEETVMATLAQFAENAVDVWRRGIATAFSALDRRFRSHDGFAIRHRIILSNAFDEYGWWNYHRNHCDTLVDIERIFLIMDGESPRAPYAGIIGTIDKDRKALCRQHAGGFQSEHTGDYFKARIYGNGNMHLWMTRRDLVDRVNAELAEYYGAALGWGSSTDAAGDAPTPGGISAASSRAPAKGFGAFVTPEPVVREVMRLAELHRDDGLLVLEPSAGSGNIARPVAEMGHQVVAVEIQGRLVDELRASGHYRCVLHRDLSKGGFIRTRSNRSSSPTGAGVVRKVQGHRPCRACLQIPEAWRCARRCHVGFGSLGRATQGAEVQGMGGLYEGALDRSTAGLFQRSRHQRQHRDPESDSAVTSRT